MTTAFVAGSTGYTGRAVLEELRRRGHRDRGPRAPRLVEPGDLGPRFEALAVVADAALAFAGLLGAGKLRDPYSSLDAAARRRLA